MERLIELLEMMAKNDLATWKDGTKIHTDSYMKGAGERTEVIVNMLKQRLQEESKEDAQSPSYAVHPNGHRK